jgi:DNA-binding transcriptional regulator/RsmH inhibitor MraZ
MSELADSSGAPVGGPTSPGTPDADWTSFTWRHTHKLDPQKRVAFPADWRPSDPNCKIMLVLWPHPHAERKHGFILGMLPPRYRQLQTKLAAGSLGDDRTGALRRAIFTNAVALKLDPAGRLCLPADMADSIGLQKEVFFAGGGADFEVWDPATFARCQTAEAPLAAEAYKLLN